MVLQLKKEYKIFRSHLNQWLTQHSGEFVLIKGIEVIGFFETYEGALNAGLQRFGNVPFFIKAVLEKEEVHVFCNGLS